MGKTRRDEIIVGLDIGTTKIAAIVGELTEEGIDIIGIGTAPSRGLRKGVVVNIDATVQSIQKVKLLQSLFPNFILRFPGGVVKVQQFLS